MELVLNWLFQNQTLTLVIAFISLIVFILSFKIITKNIISSNRGVSAGRDINAPIMTGDINSNRTSTLGILANIATIIALIVSVATLYVSYLALVK